MVLELGVKVRVRHIAVASESFGVWPLLPAVAVMLITLFVWSLAQAAPVDGVKDRAANAYRIPAANIAIRTLPTDYMSDPEAALFFAPAAEPSYESYRIRQERPRIRETN